jgi:uncharacterized protein YutE (UPF0331/DUF86 family)
MKISNDSQIIPGSFARRFIYIAGLRNFLAHDYQIENSNELINFFKTGLIDTEKYVYFIEKL